MCPCTRARLDEEKGREKERGTCLRCREVESAGLVFCACAFNVFYGSERRICICNEWRGAMSAGSLQSQELEDYYVI